jgi:hypothetical protein
MIYSKFNLVTKPRGIKVDIKFSDPDKGMSSLAFAKSYSVSS